MICGTFKMVKLSEKEARAAVVGYKSNDPPPDSVEKKQEADGTWTVTANWPPCPKNTSHTKK